MRSACRRSASLASTPIGARAVVIVFARAPLAGRAKTRLAAAIGAAAAARLQQDLVRTALATARAVRCGPVELHVTRRHALFRSLRAPVRMQRGGELGARMYRALRDALCRHKHAVLIGADAPALAPVDIACALRWLRGGADLVLAPAEDGGYALIAARRIAPEVFAAVEWGSGDVLAQTLRNIARARMNVKLLRSVWDVDRPADLERFRSRRFSLAARRRARR
jgi:uncharacterized protein